MSSAWQRMEGVGMRRRVKKETRGRRRLSGQGGPDIPGLARSSSSTCTHAHTHAHKHMHTHTYTHTHSHTHTHKHTHTHTHTHTLSFISKHYEHIRASPASKL